MTTLIDLSHPLVDAQPAYPGDPPPQIERIGALAVDGYNLTRLGMTVHQGTHLDAPHHFLDDGATIDKLSLDRFVGPARKIELATGATVPSGFFITMKQLVRHAAAFVPGGRVLLQTGWSTRYGRAEYYPDTQRDESVGGPPQLTVEAARWIASTGIVLLGIDWPTPSYEQLAEVHRILLGAQSPIVILENLANLEALPQAFTLIALPLAINGAEGSPVRAVAVVE